MKYFIVYYLMFTKPRIYGKAWKVSHKKRPYAILSIITYQLIKQQKQTISKKNTMEQTAVEWLVDKLMEGEFVNHTDELIEQAKLIEKQQIIEAFNQSWHDRMDPYKTAEKYYNDKYRK